MTEPSSTDRQNSMGSTPTSKGDEHAAANVPNLTQHQGEVGCTLDPDSQHTSTREQRTPQPSNDLEDPTLTWG